MRPYGELRRRLGRGGQAAESRQLRVPEEREIVPMRLEEADEGVEVQRLQGAMGAPVLQRVPRMRSAQDERGAAGVREVVRILRGPERGTDRSRGKWFFAAGAGLRRPRRGRLRQCQERKEEDREANRRVRFHERPPQPGQKNRSTA